jgi:Zn-dependent alcohol dehydrogenase
MNEREQRLMEKYMDDKIDLTYLIVQTAKLEEIEVEWRNKLEKD